MTVMEAKNVQLAIRVDGTPGAGITASDIAHALGHIRKQDYSSLLLRAKYLLDEEAGRTLLRRLKGYLLVMSAVEGLNVSTSSAATIAHALLLSAVSPSFCQSCNGNGGLMIDRKWESCRTCRGDGRVRNSDNDMAMSLNISRAEWVNSWKKRFDGIRTTMRQWETEGLIWVATVKTL